MTSPITAAEAKALADIGTGVKDADLNSIYSLITAEATAGKYYTDWVIAHQSVKSSIITQLTTADGYEAVVSDDGLRLEIGWFAV